MTLPRLNRHTALCLGELALIILLAHYFSTGLEAAFAAMHLPLPEMPLLKHAYLLFSLTLLIAVWVRWRGETLKEFGLIMPPHWLVYFGQGVAIFAAGMAVDIFGRPFIDPLIAHATGASRTLAEQHFAPLRGNLPMLIYLIPVAWIFGGLGEELLYRGFIMTRMAQLLGAGRGAWIAAAVLQAVPFALAHGYQGPVGMFGVFMAGVIYGLGTLVWGRNLWPAMVAHGLRDTTAFILIYAGVVHA